jgi:hypothetical protein
MTWTHPSLPALMQSLRIDLSTLTQKVVTALIN